jgi:hypothetical protein
LEAYQVMVRTYQKSIATNIIEICKTHQIGRVTEKVTNVTYNLTTTTEHGQTYVNDSHLTDFKNLCQNLCQ